MREERERSNYQNMEPASLLEGFLWEVDKAENKNDEYVTGEAVQTVLLYVGQENLYSFIPSEENMLAVMRDMVIAGGDTVNNAIWSLRYTTWLWSLAFNQEFGRKSTRSLEVQEDLLTRIRIGKCCFLS